MTKTWTPVTQAEVDYWRTLAAERMPIRQIAVQVHRGHQTVRDYVTGKRTVRCPKPVVPPTERCTECNALAALHKQGRSRKLRRCRKHGGE